VTPGVTAAVLLAAVTHACWNALAHKIPDKLVGFTLITGGGGVVGLLAAPFVGFPERAAWQYLLASAVIHIAYLALLMWAFRIGDFGQAYPIARGSAPLVVTLLAALFAHEVPNGWGALGIALSCAGLTGVALWGLRGRRPNWVAVGAALGTGFTIALYTVVDGLGVRAAGSSFGYIAWLMIVQGSVLPLYAWARWRGETFSRLKPHAGVGAVGALLLFTAYALVLWAQTRAELAPIAALRESSIIVGAAIGAVFFKERFGVSRVVAAGVLVVGIGLMLRGG